MAVTDSKIPWDERRDAAEAAARDAIRNYGVVASDADSIDPVVIARQLDINVWSCKLNPEVSGMIVKFDEASTADVSIFLNHEHSSKRQRFTCAHELGHYFDVLRKHPALDVSFAYLRGDTAACGTNEEEVFANQFAAELLMPAESVIAAHNGGTRSEMTLASKFKVSVPAMHIRLKNLHLIED